jgi:cyanophycinase
MRYFLTAAVVLMAMLTDGSAFQEPPPAGLDGTSTAPLPVRKTEGTLLVVGGGIIPDAVRDKFLELAGGRKARLVVIPTASHRIDSGEVPSSYKFWRSQDVASVEWIHTRNPEQANDPSFIKPLESATGVWLGGGDQSLLTAAYRGTAVLEALRRVLDRGGVVGGTSAGASVMSAVMITGGTARAELGTGFGLAPGLVVDQHFANRNRMGRLLSAVARRPDLVGVGIDEQTAVVLKGTTMSVIGDAHVWVCLPASTMPVSVQQLKSGDWMDFASEKLTLTASKPAGWKIRKRVS